MLSTLQWPHANACCETIERSRGDVGAGFESCAVCIFGAVLHHQEHADGVEAGLAGIAPLGADPIDLGGGDVGPGFDAAAPLLNGGLDHHFVAWCGNNTRRHRLRAWVDCFEREQVGWWWRKR